MLLKYILIVNALYFQLSTASSPTLRPAGAPTKQNPTVKPSQRNPTMKPSDRKPTMKPSTRNLPGEPSKIPTKKPTVKPTFFPVGGLDDLRLSYLPFTVQSGRLISDKKNVYFHACDGATLQFNISCDPDLGRQQRELRLYSMRYGVQAAAYDLRSCYSQTYSVQGGVCDIYRFRRNN